MKNIYDVLRQKEQDIKQKEVEIQQLQRDIETLRAAVHVLEESENSAAGTKGGSVGAPTPMPQAVRSSTASAVAAGTKDGGYSAAWENTPRQFP